MMKYLFTLLICLGFSQNLTAVINELDTDGVGTRKRVDLAFTYYHSTPTDQLSLIHQGGYKVYDLSKDTNAVAIIGTLNPCIGIAVTDGKKMVTFHRHYSNPLDCMMSIIRTNLDVSDPSSLLAGIYTAQNDSTWTRFRPYHGGQSHTEVVRQIKNTLVSGLRIERRQVQASLYNLNNAEGDLRYPDHSLGKYEFSELCVAVRMSDAFEMVTIDGPPQRIIKFWSIDPCQANLYGLRGQTMYPQHFALRDLSPRVLECLAIGVPYDDMDSNSQHEAVRHQIQQEEDRHYMRKFGKSPADLFLAANYRELKKMKSPNLDFFEL